MGKLLDEILEYWRDDQCVRVSGDIFKVSNIPAETVQFFDIAFLPSSPRLLQSLGFNFDILGKNEPVSLAQYFSDENGLPDEMSSWIVIGHCFEQMVCIQTGNGAIVLLDGNPSSGFLSWFVNSSVLEFVYSITKSMQCFEDASKSSKVGNPIPQLIKKLSAVDTKAFADRTRWWPTILAEVERGRI